MRYEVSGTVMQTVGIDLSPGDVIYSQTAAMAWMTDGVSMQTTPAAASSRGSAAASQAAASSSPSSAPTAAGTWPSPRASRARSWRAS